MILLGSQEIVARAEKIVHDTEEQLQDPAEMTVYLYSCKHSDPGDLAKVLEKVYNSLLLIPSTEVPKEVDVSVSTPGYRGSPPDGYPPASPLVVSPPRSRQEPPQHLNIPSRRRTILFPILRRGACSWSSAEMPLSKIKDLLKRLDIPKKMVPVKIMLFEKTLNSHNAFGMNLLKLGHHNKINFHSSVAPIGRGVLEFIFRHKIPIPPSI